MSSYSLLSSYTEAKVRPLEEAQQEHGNVVVQLGRQRMQTAVQCRPLPDVRISMYDELDDIPEPQIAARGVISAFDSVAPVIQQ